jgi:hypothetical protein
MRTVGRVVLLVATAGGLYPPVSAAERLCDTVVGLLATVFVGGVPNSQLARVEMRQCSPELSATIQLAAWRSGDVTPALVVDTSDFGIVQAAARKNVFIVETSGGPRDQVFVIVYNRGEPKLALRRVTKGTALINISASAVDLIIEGIYAGDLPPRTESQHFALDLGEMRPR